ncbi:MAG TPA: hydroxymethylglutaryl-CoA lyase [Streptomyces sp.]|nr:hydroxymethylglutaryl-CoA lyase [Streptomyces sp.]
MDVTLTEVVLRDGLQDEPVLVPVADRIALAGALADAGLTELEAASFVSTQRVPQMAGAEELLAGLPRRAGVRIAGLALNLRGARRAAATRIDRLHLAVSASAGHSAANAGRGVDRALDEISTAFQELPGTLDVLGCVATAFVCPYDGPLAPVRLLSVVRRLHTAGFRKIGLADTLGTAATGHVVRSVGAVREEFPDLELSLHLHNAHGQALQTVDAALGLGVVRFDSSLGGLGGCPFAPGAHGNLATEEIVAHLHGRGLDTGVDEARLAEAGRLLKSVLARAEPLPA